MRKKNPKVVYRTFFWKKTRSTTKKDWKSEMDVIKKVNPTCKSAYDYLMKINKREWARHF